MGFFFVTRLHSGAFLTTDEADECMSNSNHALDISEARSLNDHTHKKTPERFTSDSVDTQGLCSVEEEESVRMCVLRKVVEAV